MEKTIKDLEKQLLSKVAQFSSKKKNAVELEKVCRYVNLTRQYYELQKAVEKEGLIVETRNASQTFFKENPAISAQLKISAQLLAIEKSFSFIVDNPTVKEEEVEGLLDA